MLALVMMLEWNPSQTLVIEFWILAKLPTTRKWGLKLWSLNERWWAQIVCPAFWRLPDVCRKYHSNTSSALFKERKKWTSCFNLNFLLHINFYQAPTTVATHGSADHSWSLTLERIVSVHEEHDFSPLLGWGCSAAGIGGLTSVLKAYDMVPCDRVTLTKHPTVSYLLWLAPAYHLLISTSQYPHTVSFLYLFYHWKQ